ncbi:TVP38/TMEM64 family protein [Legionella sp. km772]|uniref:TVP38/TMEM64 family protein n=1 Tax=Legionella sp. km772 TaxID=2498111 RepID=UPI000F8E5F98|nr:VTT domain-containing protein [Legionella sp. km772]RUR08917.1 TVP38/TMEM64 family protein [Legionella sp. km772]
MMPLVEIKWLKQALILIVLAWLTWELHSYRPFLIELIPGLGVYAFFSFFLLYCLSALVFLPIEPLVLLSGGLFGFYYGFLINLLSAVVSAVIAFMLSRRYGLSFITNSKQGRLIQWLERLETLGWKSLALSRLMPFLPCAVVNYGYGLTRMNLFVYTLTNIVFFIPYKLVLSYVGAHL